MRASSRLLCVLFAMLVAIAALSVCAEQRQSNYEASVSTITAFLSVVSASSLACSSDCTSTRNVLEGVYGCLSDIPGGYCFHSSCDVISLPEVSDVEVFQITVAKKDSR